MLDHFYPFSHFSRTSQLPLHDASLLPVLTELPMLWSLFSNSVKHFSEACNEYQLATHWWFFNLKHSSTYTYPWCSAGKLAGILQKCEITGIFFHEITIRKPSIICKKFSRKHFQTIFETFQCFKKSCITGRKNSRKFFKWKKIQICECNIKTYIVPSLNLFKR